MSDNERGTFKLRRNSWHFRFWRLFRITHFDYGTYPPRKVEPIPKDFCTYWRWQMIMWLAVLVVFGVAVSAMGLAAYAYFVKGWFDHAIPTALAHGALATLVVLYYFSVMGVVAAVRNYRSWSNTRPPKAPKPPNPFRLWLKARKERFCPLIEMVEE